MLRASFVLAGFVLGCTTESTGAGGGPLAGGYSGGSTAMLDAAGRQDAESHDAATPLAPLIPATLFGFTINHPGTSTLPNVLATPGPTTARIWDTSYPSGSLEWPGINQCPPGVSCAANPAQSTFDWSNLDDYLASLKTIGYADVLYTVSRTPDWASQLGSRCAGAGSPDATCTGAPDNSCDHYGAPPRWSADCVLNGGFS
jgi:hypothetical protein